MSQPTHHKLRAIVEDIHEDMMRSLVDASHTAPPAREPFDARLGECGFDGTAASANHFQRATVRMLTVDLSDEQVVTVMEACLLAPSPDASVRNLERYLETAGNPSVFLRTMLSAPPVLNLVTVVFGASEHLADILVRQPGLAYWLMEQGTWTAVDTVESYEAWFAGEAERFSSVEAKFNAVRRAHRQALLKIGVLDLVSGIAVEDVTRRLSALADASARVVLDVVFDDIGGDRDLPRSLVVIAMGKLGGGELNYSSDIDLIFASNEADDETMHHYARVARRFTDAMSALTEEGYLYRVDLRLRPDGKAGPLVNSDVALRVYYEHRGRPWEFQALLKARPIAGDIELGERLLADLGQLIFNPALPYSPLETVGAMREQIKDHARAQQRGHNIKLMAGGIRDIEFIAQALQIIHAPQHRALRTPTTLIALSEIRRLGLMSEWDVDNLSAAYRFFRLVEHRLQMMHQLQTHTLPDSEEEIALLARRVSNGPLGSFTTDTFIETLSKHLNHVRTLADSFFAGESVHPHSVLLMLPEDSERAIAIIRQYGIADVGRAIRTLHAMAYGSFPRLLDRRARAAFEDLLPLLLRDASETANPEQTLAHVASIAAAEKSEATFYRMLVDSPSIRGLVMGIAGMSSLLTRELCAQIGVLDSLIEDDGGTVDAMLSDVPEWERFAATDATARAVRTGVAAERQNRERLWFERLRLYTFADCLRHRFAAGPHGITGELARAHAARLHLTAAFQEMVPEKERVAVFAFGSHATGEPRIHSDLDLIVVADGVDLPELMTRVQAINSWFVDGRILKLDFRLRAEGASSPLVQDLAFYDDYFARRASLWERIAFAKCAFWWGGEEIRRQFQRRLRSFAVRPFSKEEVVQLAQMRRRVEGLAPKHFTEWDTKRSAGGRYDIEYLNAVGMAETCGDRLDYFTMSTAERVRALVQSGYLSRADGAVLEEALSLFTRVEHFIELQEMTHPGSEAKAQRVQQILSMALPLANEGWVDARDTLSQSKAAVRNLFTRVFGS
ncbi:MAG TPA: nucleotidyltransferase domain-containing protein [Candidatus Krumholzibacteria bacterium]